MVTFTNLTAQNDTVDRTTYTTASISPTGDRLVLLTINAFRNTGSAQPALSSVSGGGMTTWDLVRTQDVDVAGGDRATMWVYRAMQATPGTGAISIVVSGAALSACSWSVDQSSSDVDTGGTNGSAAVVSANIVGGTATAAETDAGPVSYAQAIGAGNCCWAATGWQAAAGHTPQTGWTELSDVGGGNCGLATQYADDDTETEVSSPVIPSSRWGIVGLEIAAASAGPINVNVDSAALTLAGADATIAGSGSTSITSNSATALLVGIDVAITGTGTSTIAAGHAALVLAGVDVDASAGATTATVEPAVLALSGTDAALAGVGTASTSTDTATLSLAAITATVLGSGSTAAPVDAAVLALTAPTPPLNGTGVATIDASPAALALAGVDLTIGSLLEVAVDPAALSLTSVSPMLVATGAGTLVADPAEFTLTGATPTAAGSSAAPVDTDSAVLLLAAVVPLLAGSGTALRDIDPSALLLAGAEVIGVGREPDANPVNFTVSSRGATGTVRAFRTRGTFHAFTTTHEQ